MVGICFPKIANRDSPYIFLNALRLMQRKNKLLKKEKKRRRCYTFQADLAVGSEIN